MRISDWSSDVCSSDLLKLIALYTAMLLFSSITYGFAVLQMQQGKVKGVQIWLGVTGLFGLAFLGIELYEFHHLIEIGAGPQRSAFLSSFFTLVGTHGLHVTFGIVWLVTLMFLLSKHGLIAANKRRVMCLSMFWHFLDVVWIGVFTFVYLMGVLRRATIPTTQAAAITRSRCRTRRCATMSSASDRKSTRLNSSH